MPENVIDQSKLSPDMREQMGKIKSVLEWMDDLKFNTDDKAALVITVIMELWRREHERFPFVWHTILGNIYTTIASVQNIAPPETIVIPKGPARN